MISYKNTLQEYFQKKGAALPKYNSTALLSSINNGACWVSEVTLYNNEKFRGGAFSKRKHAEMDAARMALEYIDNLDHSVLPSFSESEVIELCNISNNSGSVTQITSTAPIKKAIFIDVENLHNFHKDIKEHHFDMFDVYVFVGMHHHLAKTQFHKKIRRIVSPSAKSDGTDACIQVFTGVCLAQNKYDDYYIATRDKFGEALVDMINNSIGYCDKSDVEIWIPKKAKVVVHFSEVIQ